MTKDKYPGIRSFEDLKCWQEARNLCRVLLETLDMAGEKSYIRQILAGEIYKRAARITEDIAASFSLNDIPSFLDGMKEALRECRRLKSLLYPMMDSGLIEPEKVDGIFKDVDDVARAIKDHIRYLSNMEIKERYREMDEF